MAVGLYFGAPYFLGLSLPFTIGVFPFALLVSIVRPAVTLLWLRHVVQQHGAGTLHASLGFRLVPRDLGIGVIAGVVIAYGSGIVQDAVIAVVGPSGSDSGWADISLSMSRSQFVIIAVIGIVTAPVTEELVFRGALLRSLSSRLTPPQAVLASAAIFGAGHMTPTVSFAANLVTFVSIAAVGVALAMLARWSNRLGPGIVAHTVDLFIAFSSLIART